MTRRRILSVSIHDCEVQHFRSGGKGGQNQNKRDTGCRVIHHPSGARGESREERSQLQNKRRAFLRMIETARFKIWMQRETFAQNSYRWDDQTTAKLDPEELKIEVRRGGRWEEVKEDDIVN